MSFTFFKVNSVSNIGGFLYLTLASFTPFPHLKHVNSVERKEPADLIENSFVCRYKFSTRLQSFQFYRDSNGATFSFYLSTSRKKTSLRQPASKKDSNLFG